MLPFILFFVPWQQNVPGNGNVSALDPLDRIRVIPAPVSGRLVDLRVQEGSHVNKGDVLAVVEDLDPEYSARLGSMVVFARTELEAAHSALESLDKQLIQLQDERDFSIKEAKNELLAAIEKVKVERAVLVGIKADLDQKQKDFLRKGRLYKLGAKSELDFQEAESSFKGAQSKASASESKITEILHMVETKAATVKKVEAEKTAKIDKLRADRKGYEQKLQQVRKKVAEAETKMKRQSTQLITAPRNGSILRIHGAATDLIARGQSLFDIVPDIDEFALELWIKGNDAPLVSEGRAVRIQFEGWPAIQISGWPSVAKGTFGGIVYRSDALALADGRVRVLIVPDPEDEPWPKQPFLRQGVRANGFILLDTVSIGYEIWRQLNAFPQSVSRKPSSSPSAPLQKKKSGDVKSGK
ncbi:MAG: HlyD family efflux transporter periplasmic adaptor subunit [Verrucomicrobiales bacterium]|nr:HlyD family efflux transporter periplasmic adaptor subunit [Verrucomicrobiales bacterium]